MGKHIIEVLGCDDITAVPMEVTELLHDPDAQVANEYEEIKNAMP